LCYLIKTYVKQTRLSMTHKYKASLDRDKHSSSFCSGVRDEESVFFNVGTRTNVQEILKIKLEHFRQKLFTAVILDFHNKLECLSLSSLSSLV